MTNFESPKRKPGRILMDEESIPAQLRRMLAEQLDAGAQISPAREGGGYKGRVIYSSDLFLVQAVVGGAVIHRQQDVKFLGQRLELRAKDGLLANLNIQVHYAGSKGRAYVWNKDRDQAVRAGEALASMEMASAQLDDRTAGKSTTGRTGIGLPNSKQVAGGKDYSR